MPNEEPQGPTEPQSPGATTPAGSDASPAQPAAAHHDVWQERVSSFAGWLCAVGVVLVLSGLVWVTGSAWTLPLIVVGIIMVVIAWVGSRLDGRFAIEWGSGGTQVEFRAQIKPPAPVVAPVRLARIPAAQPPHLRTPARSAVEASDVIEGQGHTVEIDVAELKTLIRAAEAREAAQDDDGEHGPAATDESQQRPAA